MERERVKVLLIEDDEDDYVLIRDWLSQIPHSKYELEWVSTYERGLEAIARGSHHVCLLDYRLGRHDGLDLLRNAMKNGCTAPIIFLTGQGDYDVDVRAMKAGADDYLVKGQISFPLLERSIRYAIERKRTERIQAESRAKSEFLSSMSHELRTPLNAIIGFSQVLEEQSCGELNETQAQYVEDILDSGMHLLSLINDILDLSKIEAGKMDPEISQVHIRELVEQSLIMIKEKASRHGITLDLHIAPALEELKIAADERMLKQIMLNLLSNASKFTPDGGSIRISAETGRHPLPEHDGASETAFGQEAGETGEEPLVSRKVIKICVTDTGIGISSEDRKRIFDEFYQVKRGTMGKPSGTGLGLSLAKRFVEVHGGRIWSESEGPGKGSRFCFVLPIDRSALDT